MALLSFAVIAQPTHGILTGTAPNLTYTPAANFYGTDSSPSTPMMANSSVMLPR